jgi:transcriptional regulator with GAF, ATPase, and Fis domain
VTRGGLVHPESGATQHHDPVGQRRVHRGLSKSGVRHKMRVKSETQMHFDNVVVLIGPNKDSWYGSLPACDLPSQTTTAPTEPVTLAEAERDHILNALRKNKWVLGGAAGAAARLCAKRPTAIGKMRKSGLSRAMAYGVV